MATDNPPPGPRKSAPTPLSEILRETMERVQKTYQHPPPHSGMAAGPAATEDARRAARVLTLQRACNERNLPRHAAIRKVLYEDHPPRTEPVRAVVSLARWREAQRLPVTGEAPGGVVVLVGPVGTGKTSGGCWALARWPRSAYYATATEVAGVPESDWSEIRALRELWHSCDCLFLDELGQELAARAGPRVAALVAARYDLGRATILATNLDQNTFSSRYFSLDGSGRRMDSRLTREQQHEGGIRWWWPTDSHDYRDPGNARHLAELPRLAGDLSPRAGRK